MWKWIKVTAWRLLPVVPASGAVGYRVSREALAGTIAIVLGLLGAAGLVDVDPVSGGNVVASETTEIAHHLVEAIVRLLGLLSTVAGWWVVNNRHRAAEEGR